MNKTIELDRGWLLAIDPENNGKETGMQRTIPASALPAPVPGILQQVYTSYHGVAWYYLTIDARTALCPSESERLYLHFGAVDYFSEIFLDGEKIG